MDGTIGEIRLFAGNFAPRNWAFCNGTLLSIEQNTALFSIIGCTYGGDCRVSMALPDLRGRIPIGTGYGPGLSPRTLGQHFGTEDETLSLIDLPSHNHGAALVAPELEGTVEFAAHNGKGTQVNDPTGAYMADAPNKTGIYSTDTNTEMGESDFAVQVTQPGGVTLNPAGGSQSHNNVQPSLGLNYIICLFGTYPSRN